VPGSDGLKRVTGEGAAMAKFISAGFFSLIQADLHEHDCWEMGIYTNGNGIATIGDQSIPFGPGTIICYPPDIPHRDESRMEFSGYFLACDGLPFSASSIPVFPDTSSRTVTSLATILNEEYHLRQPGWSRVAQDLFNLMVNYLQRCRNQKTFHPLVEHLRLMLLENIQNADFNCRRAMSALPMSIDHLRELFSHAFERTPIQYLIDLRIGTAKDLLSKGYSVKETAIRCGYSDPYYFSRLFLKMTGMRPSEYAK
jgi:AraC-like DNA-binding protein